MGLGIRLLPGTKDDADQAANIKFAQKFGLNQRNKRAAIQASSIFSTDTSKQSPKAPGASSILRQRLDLVAKRRKVNAAGVKELLCSKFKPLVRGVLERESRLVKAPVKIKQA